MAVERFERLVDEFAGHDGVTPPAPGGGFGSGALRRDGKIFAMLVRGELVVKLPRARVDALVAGGAGVRFDANRGTPMKEWFRVAPGSTLDWSQLTREALDFARGEAGTAGQAGKRPGAGGAVRRGGSRARPAPDRPPRVP